MKKFFVFGFSVISLLSGFLFLSCSDGSSDDSVPQFSVTDASDWDNWDDLTSGTIGDWIVGDWNCTYRTINNLEDEDDLDLKKVTLVCSFKGPNNSDEVIFSESSDTSIIQNTSFTLSKFKSAMEMAYADDLFENTIKELEDYGVTISSVSNNHIWRKVNQEKTKMEFYKSIKIKASYQGESHTLVAQVNESFSKQE